MPPIWGELHTNRLAKETMKSYLKIHHAHLGAKKWTLGFSATPEG
jgi:hypothetical protein